MNKDSPINTHVTPSFIQFLDESNNYTQTIENLSRLELPPATLAQYINFMQTAPISIIFVDHHKNILFTNKTIEYKLRKKQAQLIGRPITEVIPLNLTEDDQQEILNEVNINNHWSGRFSFIDKENKVKRVWLKVSRFTHASGSPTYGILFFDTENINYRDFNSHSLSYYDNKTFLPNFNQFAVDINQMIRNKDKMLKGIALIRCQNLSEITVHHSRKTMDEVTNTMIRRIKQTLPKGYYLYRLSRDVFAVFSSKFNKEEEFKVIIEQIYQTLFTPLSIGSKKIFLTNEIGVVFYPTQIMDLTELLLSAEICLNQRDTTKVTYYSEEISNEYTLSIQTIEKLQSALEDNQIKVLYQPIVAPDGKIKAAEALLRWRDDDLGAVSPLVIIKGAKEYGHIHKLTTWIFNKVAEDRLFEKIPVTINLDAVQITHECFFAEIQKHIDNQTLDPKQIVFELTEHESLNRCPKVMTLLSKLKELGFRLAIDDFGVGYSDFGLLADLDFDILKVDATFIKGIKEKPKKEIILKNILLLANDLGLLTCFEGIETETELAYAKELGSDCLQGFYFSQAISLRDLTQKYL